MLRCIDSSRHQKGGCHQYRPQPTGRRSRLRQTASSGCGSRSITTRRPNGYRVTRIEYRFFQPYGAKDALGADENRSIAGRQDGLAQWREPVDYLTRSPYRWPRLASTRMRSAYWHWYSAAGPSAPGCAFDRNTPPTPSGGGRQQPGNPVGCSSFYSLPRCIRLRCSQK